MFALPDNPYEIIGVVKNAQIPEIRTAYRKLVLKCHPDKVTDPAQKAIKQEEFQKVQKAYETLSNENERQKYDDMVRANELEKENAERRKQREREFTPGRTPPRSYDSDYGKSPRFTVHVNAEPGYKVRTAEPREPPPLNKSSTWTAGSKSPYASNTRTPPRSYEEMHHYSSFEDMPTRDSRDSRDSRRPRETSSYKDKISRHEEDKRARRKVDDDYEAKRVEEKAAKRIVRDRAERKEIEKEQERKEKERRDKLQRKADKGRDAERKRDSDDKRSRHKTAYVEEEPEHIIFNSKLDKKSKSSSRSKEVPIQSREDREHRSEREVKHDKNLSFAAQYLETSRGKGAPRLGRSQTYHYNPRDVDPPPPPPAVATPPPAANGMAPPPPSMPSMASRMYDVTEEDEEPILRSAAPRRRNSDTPKNREKSTSHKKSGSGRDADFVAESSRPANLKHANTMPIGGVHQSAPLNESPPKLARSKTEFVRPNPGVMPRTSAWTSDDAQQERSRPRQYQRYESNDESEEDVRPRRSHRTHSPDQMPGTFRYTVENGRTKAAPRTSLYREESPPRRKGYYPEPNMSRPLEQRPKTHSYDSYNSQQFGKVRTARAYDTEDVQFSNMPYTSRGEVYGYG